MLSRLLSDTRTKGAKIDVPTPAFLIAGFGWVVLLALFVAINLGLHRAA